MECKNCKVEMKKGKLKGEKYFEKFYICHKINKLFDPYVKSTISGYVCPECGEIKLVADEPENFKLIEE